jgi:hypothetical protein
MDGAASNDRSVVRLLISQMVMLVRVAIATKRALIHSPSIISPEVMDHDFNGTGLEDIAFSMFQICTSPD